MKNTLVTALSCLIVGSGIGYLVGQSGQAEAERAEPSSVSRLSARIPSGASGGGRADQAPRSYADIAATPGQTARIQKLIDLYADLDPSEFKDQADQLNDLPFSERILASYLLFASWAEVAPYDALDHANSKMGFAGNFVKPTILQSWAATDASGAANYYEANKNEFAMMGMMGRGRGGRGGGQTGAAVISGEWAKQDAEGALAWAQTLNGRDKGQAATGALAEIAKVDPEAAAAKLAELGEEGGDRAYRSIATEWAKKDWDATENWINTLPEDQRDTAMEDAIGSLAVTDIEKAAQKALTFEGELRAEAFEDVAQAMAGDDAPEAMSWVMENGNAVDQQEAVGEVMNSWVGQDRSGALEWISSQESGGVRDEAVQSFIFNDHSQTDGSTLAMAESITDEGARQRAVGVAAFRWLNNDQDSALEYIRASDVLDDTGRDRLLRRAGIETE